MFNTSIASFLGISGKELLLLAISTVLTLILGIALVHWLAPGLLGIPADLKLVRTSEEVPPFFDNVFRPEDLTSRDFLLPDPLLSRAKPLINDMGSAGPNDLLGFRNRMIPNRAAVISIGDSQTYGNNAALERNWPSVLGRELGLRPQALYSMATGGWSAIEYLYIADKAHALRPRLIIVAFYSGNDPVEAFVRAYGNPNWQALRLDPSLSADDAPKIPFPAPKDEIWHTRLSDGTEMAFTPTLRHGSIKSHPAVDTGWRIMAAVAEQLSEVCRRTGTDLLFTLIPTKETAMRKRIAAGDAEPPTAYRELVVDEASRIAWFSERLSALPHGRYLDVVGPLQRAALTSSGLYPTEPDGHPLADGYAVIARTLAQAIDADALQPKLGAYAVGPATDDLRQLRLLTEDGWWLFDGVERFAANGWVDALSEPGTGKAPAVPYSDGAEFSAAPYLGVIDRVDRSRFGPDAFQTPKGPQHAPEP